SFIQSVQNDDDDANFTIYPSGDRKEYYVNRYLILRSNRNPASIGYDFGTDPTRLKAMEAARDMGTATISGKVTFINKNNNKNRPGFILVVPVYEGSTVPATVAERRSKIQGFVYSPFESPIFFKGILGETNLPQLVNFQIYNGEHINTDTLLFDSRKDKRQINYI